MARLLTGAGAVAALLVAGLVSAAPASASVVHHVYRTCSTAGGCGLWLRNGPSTTAGHLGLMSDGQAFTVNCWAVGPTVINDPIWLQGSWNNISGWAMDYYIDTHWAKTADLTAQGIPQCGSAAPAPAPTPPPTGGVTAAENGAVNWAKSQVNSPNYNGACLSFAFDAYSRAGVNLRPWVNVSINGMTYPENIWGRFNHGRTGNASSTPPVGALVFFNSNGGHGVQFSHVAISTGGGGLVSSGDSINRSIHAETLTQRANARLWNTYVGWWLPDA